MSLKIMMKISMKYDDAVDDVVVVDDNDGDSYDDNDDDSDDDDDDNDDDDDDDSDDDDNDDNDDNDDDIMISSGENESTVHRDAAWVIRKLWTQYRLGSVDEVCI